MGERHSSLDHLIGKQSGRKAKIKRLGGFKIDHQLEVSGLLHRQVFGFGAFEDATGIAANLVIRLGKAGPKLMSPPATVNSRRWYSAVTRAALPAQRCPCAGRPRPSRRSPGAGLRAPHEGGKGRLDITLGASIQDQKAHAKNTGRASRQFRCFLAIARVRWIDEHRNRCGRWREFVEFLAGVLASISLLSWVTPVRLPPGRLRLTTRPNCDRVYASPKDNRNCLCRCFSRQNTRCVYRRDHCHLPDEPTRRRRLATFRGLPRPIGIRSRRFGPRCSPRPLTS